jgi:hypothetical protein
MAIDRFRYPWLHIVAHDADWLGTDEFHRVAAVGGGLWETWLGFVAANSGLRHYVSRLKRGRDQCAIAFNEIAVAHFLATECGMGILGWQPPGAANTQGEFLVGLDANQPIFVEVKSPRWQAEIAQADDRDPRLMMPKYPGVETRSTNPWASVEHAVEKAHRQMPDSIPTLLVIIDDLLVSLADWAAQVHDIGLYTPKSGLKPEGGPFADDRYDRLGAVGVLKVIADIPFQGVGYRFALFENPHARPTAVLPPGIGGGWPRYNPAGRVA